MALFRNSGVALLKKLLLSFICLRTFLLTKANQDWGGAFHHVGVNPLGGHHTQSLAIDMDQVTVLVPKRKPIFQNLIQLFLLKASSVLL